MPEYELKFTEDGETSTEEAAERKKTLDELAAFIHEMKERPLAGVSLNEEQSTQWDEKGGEFDYQDHYGREIVGEVSADGETEALVIHNAKGLPVAMAAKGKDGGWQGIGVDERLREAIAGMLQVELS
ncbi:hypothetical protein MNBD_GAMMA26-472 [hydrothermal vent metagenome]|uniref:Uncharacterized protein n=1 Tax=hydrothermal vent metagenome TaxID=652676 RepID=A0A3B1ASK7_9ZZZZ